MTARSRGEARVLNQIIDLTVEVRNLREETRDLKERIRSMQPPPQVRERFYHRMAKQ